MAKTAARCFNATREGGNPGERDARLLGIKSDVLEMASALHLGDAISSILHLDWSPAMLL